MHILKFQECDSFYVFICNQESHSLQLLRIVVYSKIITKFSLISKNKWFIPLDLSIFVSEVELGCSGSFLFLTLWISAIVRRDCKWMIVWKSSLMKCGWVKNSANQLFSELLMELLFFMKVAFCVWNLKNQVRGKLLFGLEFGIEL